MDALYRAAIDFRADLEPPIDATIVTCCMGDDMLHGHGAVRACGSVLESRDDTSVRGLAPLSGEPA